MLSLFRKFRHDEDGAVTVDWVVLTAAIVIITVTVVAQIKSGVDSTGGKINHAVIHAGDNL